VIRIINDLDLEVEAAVPADRLAGLTPGRAVTIVLDDGSTHEAAVRAIVPREDPQTRTRTVRFTPAFGEMERALASNQSVIVRVPVGQPRPVVTVDKDAVIARQDDRVVYVIEDGRAQPRTVTLGAAVGSRFEVLGGLDPGELVVVRGNERLQPGQPVDYRQGVDG
jgi:RND family efflux transporter MFP subunit